MTDTYYKSKRRKTAAYDPDRAYAEAMSAMDGLRDKLPTYDSGYESTLQALYQQIAERPQFSYSARDDALYQSYKQSYAAQGRMAMEDTMGRAAALSGGYASSYAQQVGGQQYDAYLQRLGEVLPETYGLAYRQYFDEGQALTDRYAMVSGLADDAYTRYQDRLDAYYAEMNRLQDAADTAYDRGIKQEQTAYDRAQDDYAKQQDAYDRLADMILTMGYVPDAAELQTAGMTNKQMNAYLSFFRSMQAVGGGGGRGKKTKDVTKTTAYKTAKKELKAIGDVEEVNGRIAQRVAQGTLDVDTARALVEQLTKEVFG